MLTTSLPPSSISRAFSGQGIALLAVILSLAGLCGCSAQSTDPIEGYKAFIKATFIPTMKKAGYYDLSDNYTFDVEKTTSLVSPFVGTTKLKAKRKMGEKNDYEMDFDITATHGLQDGRWQLTTSRATVTGGRPLENADPGVASAVIRKMTGRSFDLEL
jgi:hypothetical protein